MGTYIRYGQKRRIRGSSLLSLSTVSLSPYSPALQSGAFSRLERVDFSLPEGTVWFFRLRKRRSRLYLAISADIADPAFGSIENLLAAVYKRRGKFEYSWRRNGGPCGQSLAAGRVIGIELGAVRHVAVRRESLPGSRIPRTPRRSSTTKKKGASGP